MPPTLIVDLSTVDLGRTVLDRAAVEARIPQRHEMAFLDAVHMVDAEKGIAVGSRAVRPDEFWVRGHIPGRPILPGVLAVEAMAQLCTLLYKVQHPEDDRFWGFGGVDGVKFRGQILPGDRMVLLARTSEVKSRKVVFEAQVVVGDRMVVEAAITGMAV